MIERLNKKSLFYINNNIYFIFLILYEKGGQRK